MDEVHRTRLPGENSAFRDRLIAALLVIALAITLVPLTLPPPSLVVLSHTVTYSFGAVTTDGPPEMPFSVEGTHYGPLGSSAYALPMVSEEVELPLGATTLIGLRISASEPRYLGDFHLTPLSYGNSLVPSVTMDGSSLAYSGPIYERHGAPFMPLSVTPISYKDGSAFFHEEVTVEILYHPSDSPPLPLTGDITTLSSSYDMLIITSTDMRGEFERLQRWRNALGIDTQVVTTSQVAATFPDRTLSQAIRAYSWQQHNVSGISYLLLGGGAGVIPAHTITMTAGGYTENIPADLYYGAYGGSVDWSTSFHPVADVMVGRVTVANAVEASNYVDKVIAYESRSAGDGYLQNVLFLGERLDNRVWGGQVKDTNEPYVPEGYDLVKLYERDSGLLRFNNVRPLVEEAHIINNMGHGDYDFLAALRTSNVGSIDNQAPYIWYSQGCNVGGFDRNPCVSVAMIADDSNSVANIVNSRFGWYISGPGYANGPSNLFDIAFMQRVFTSDGLLGDIHQDAKETQIANLSNQYIRWVYATLNLLGDPALKVGGYAQIPTMAMEADGDGDLDSLASLNSWEGDGSASDPYIIAGLDIVDGTGPSISLVNTTRYVTIKDSSFSGPGVAVLLRSSSNVEIVNSTFVAKDIGVDAVGGSVTISGNVFRDNAEGVRLSDAVGTLRDNSFVRGNAIGLNATGSAVHVFENVFSRGIGQAAIIIGDGSLVEDNSFVENNGTSLRALGSQALNDGSNTWRSNWWSDRDGEASYPLGDVSDDTPRDMNINDAPAFIGSNPASAASIDVLDLTATAAAGVESYAVSNGISFWNISSPLVEAGDLLLQFGMNDVVVKAYSNRGNLGVLDLSIDYLTDLPPVTVVSPSTPFINTSLAQLSWSMDDDSLLDRFSYRIGDGPFNDTNLTSATEEVEDGPQTLSVRAYATDGNFSADRREFFVDTVAPVVSLTSPLEGRLISTSSWDVTWSAYDPGLQPSCLSHITLRVNGEATVLPPDAGSAIVELDDGAQTISVTAHDNAGNSHSSSVSFRVDTGPPTVVIDEPAGHPFVTAPFRLFWNVSDASGVDRVLLRIDGAPPFDVTGRSDHLIRSLAPGYNLIEVIAVDAVGNRNWSSIGVVVGEAPLLDITSPRSAIVGTEAHVTWEMWGEDGQSYGVIVNGEATPTGSSKEATLNLSAGMATLTVWADNGTSNLTRSITVEAADKPEIAWSDPVDGQNDVLFDSDIRILYSGPMDRVLTHVALYDTSGYRIEGRTQWTSNGTLVFTPADDLDNPQGFTLEVKAFDKAGRMWVDEVAFDTRPVTVPGRPINLQATPVATFIGLHNVLTWEPPFDDGGYPLDVSPLVYSVYRHAGDGEWSLIGSTERLRFNDRHVEEGTTYHYYVSVTNILGESAPSTSASAAAAEPLGGLDNAVSAYQFSQSMYAVSTATAIRLVTEAATELTDAWNSTLVFISQAAAGSSEAWSVAMSAADGAAAMIADALESLSGADLDWLSAELLLSVLVIIIASALMLKRHRGNRMDAEFLPPELGGGTLTEADEVAKEMLRDEMSSLNASLDSGEMSSDEHRRRSADIGQRLTALHLASLTDDEGSFKDPPST